MMKTVTSTVPRSEIIRILLFPLKRSERQEVHTPHDGSTYYH